MNVEYWLGRADRALASAALVAADGDYNDACSSAYYAMFYASRSALIHIGQAERGMGKTHSGMVSAFNQYLVHPGLIDRRFSQSFGFELNRRILADYEEGGVTAEDAADAIPSAQAFVSAMKALIADQPGEKKLDPGSSPG